MLAFRRNLPRGTVAVAATLACALRLAGVPAPVFADEAGFTLVARAWDASASSVYGPYFVDRPPLVIAVFGLTDALGTPFGIRVLGALAAAGTVLLAGRIGLLVGTPASARWAAVAVAALVSTPLIDNVAVKGELLALPAIGISLWCALLAVRSAARRPVLLATSAGLAAGIAVGLKQNLVGGAVFALVLWATATAVGDLSRRRAAALVGGLVAGASVPVLATLGWALAHGVRPGVLWYTVYGFRADASSRLAEAEGAAYERLGLLVAAAVVGGIVTVLAGFVVHLRREWHRDRPVTAAVSALLVVEVAGLLAGGSYWRDYLFPLVPAAGLAVALLAARSGKVGLRMRWAAALTAASATVSFAVWAGAALTGTVADAGVRTGKAIAAAAEPGDTLVVFGGRADLQLASGLPSPYPHLWSLPMRTLDPDYGDLRALVSGPDAPTWLVEWVPFGSWRGGAAGGGAALEALLAERYVEHGTGCDGRPVLLLRGVDRPPVTADC